jgi:hypothetical protein
MAHSSRHRRILRTLLGVLMLLCFTPSGGADAQDRNAVPTSRDSGIVRLPIIDQQDIRFKRLSTIDGLSQTKVSSILQDDQGFIWFGTQYGLNRYDGYKFKLFKHEPGRPDSLSGVYVHALFKDRSTRFGSQTISSWTDSTQPPRHLLTIVSIPKIPRRCHLPSST